jgi:hypothetical protein
MSPLITLARLAGPEFEEALMGYYRATMVDDKSDVEDSTPEGLIPKMIKQTAMELLGRSERDITNLTDSKFKGEIILGEGYFEITDLHLKVWIEEALPGKTITLADVNKWIKRLMDINVTRDRRRNKANILPDVFREFRENARVNVYYYKFYFADLVPDYRAGEEKKESEVPTFRDL